MGCLLHAKLDNKSVLHFNKVTFKTVSRMIRPFTVATSSNLNLVVLKPYFESESPAEFVKNKIPKAHSHLKILIQNDCTCSKNLSDSIKILNKTALEFYPPSKQGIQSP